MKKILVALAALAFYGGQSAQAGIGFGIPLPFPFLVWTPASHCGQGSCVPRGPERTAVPKSAQTHSRTPSTAKANTGLSTAVVGAGATINVPVVAVERQ
jgi:hypothetical protein